MLSREDLLQHYPFRYEDLRDYERGVVVSGKNIYTRSGKTVQKILVKTGAGVRELTYFNQPYLVKTLQLGIALSLAGNEYEINGPNIHTGRLVPIYSETRGATSKMLRRRIYNLLKKPVPDWLPEPILKQCHLLDLNSALQKIHFPKNELEAEVAKKRLAFDEMLRLQLKALESKRLWQGDKQALRLPAEWEKIQSLIRSLPFTLTPAQNRVLKEIVADLDSNIPMNRLLQGEVGSGKTVVAAIAVYTAYLNGSLSILMAPTAILAQQHYQTLKIVFAKTPVKIGLITGSTKIEGDILVGTHALLFKKISAKVGLVVIDEQHRFGVKQRQKLLKLLPRPHLLSMTATPIPRTLALTAYADLDISLLDQLPFAKPDAKTWLVPQEKHSAAYHWIAGQIEKFKTQVFIVCPLIEASEKESMKDIKDVTSEFNKLKSIFNEFKLALIHGRLKTKEKEEIIRQFSLGKIDILVATPVIEVGIDIPQAGIMLVENAERFGLAQLHQLRGRVGRRGQKGYCLLFSQKSNSRLKQLTKISDGLKLAEMDLKFRGPGQFYGVAQHGFLKLQLADFNDLKLIALTQKVAAAIMSHASITKTENFSSADRQAPGGD